jgi:pimeloyl-ACP methyl ester carboxylesterase
MCAEWTLSETYASGDGAVRWERMGDGPPLVVLHGTPFSSYVWRRIAPALTRRWTVYAWDMLGYGASEKRAGQDVSLAAQTRLFASLLDHWGLEEPAVVAHDFGGLVSLRALLLERRRYRCLALVDPVALTPSGSPFFRVVQEHSHVFELLPAYIHEAVVGAYIQNASHRPLPAETLAALRAPWLGEDGQPAFYRQIAQFDERYIEEVMGRYGELDLPVLVVWGREDVWIPVEKGRELAAAIPGAELEILDGAGHLVQEDAGESRCSSASSGSCPRSSASGGSRPAAGTARSRSAASRAGSCTA